MLLLLAAGVPLVLCLLVQGTTYIGFGAWVGPMVLYASSLTNRDVWCFEPDPVAFAALQTNVLLNFKLYTRTHAFRQCVAATAQQSVMYGVPGDSTAALVPPAAGGAHPDNYTSWTVECVALPAFIKQHNIRVPMFIKMDCEGCERSVLPTWLRLIQDLQPGLTIFVSIHQHLTGAFTPQEVAAIQAVFARFTNVYTVHSREREHNREVARAGATGDGEELLHELHKQVVGPGFELCTKCDYVLTDMHPKGKYLSVVNATQRQGPLA